MVNYIKQLYRWFVIPWPLHLLLVFIAIHLIGLAVFSESVDSWNMHSSIFLQLFGGWYVIITINDNLGIFSNSSIGKSLRDYFQSFPPYKPRPITIRPESAVTATDVGIARIIANTKPKSMKEKVDFLYKEIERLEQDNRELMAEFVNKIDNLKSSLEESISKQKKDIENIQSRVQITFVGGAKEEALGILCIFYSLLIPYVTMLMRHLLGA